MTSRLISVALLSSLPAVLTAKPQGSPSGVTRSPNGALASVRRSQVSFPAAQVVPLTPEAVTVPGPRFPFPRRELARYTLGMQALNGALRP